MPTVSLRKADDILSRPLLDNEQADVHSDLEDIRQPVIGRAVVAELAVAMPPQE